MNNNQIADTKRQQQNVNTKLVTRNRNYKASERLIRVYKSDDFCERKK
jgi:hypothetical protein